MFKGLLFFFVASCAVGAHAQVYRCGNTYSEAPCKGGREVDVSPTLSDPSGPKTTVIFLCRSGDGALYWLQELCASRGWALERSATVSNSISWAQQVEEGRRQRSEGEAFLASPAPTYSGAPSQLSQTQREQVRRHECAALEEQVKSYDSMGRVGSTAYSLDELRMRRKAARDAQYRLRC